MQELTAGKSKDIYRRLLIIISLTIYILVLMNNYRVPIPPEKPVAIIQRLYLCSLFLAYYLLYGCRRRLAAPLSYCWYYIC